MASLRSRPLLIAPLVPAWGILGIYGSELLRGKPFFAVFIFFWFVLAGILFGYVLRQTLTARRLQRKPEAGSL